MNLYCGEKKSTTIIISSKNFTDITKLLTWSIWEGLNVGKLYLYSKNKDVASREKTNVQMKLTC